MLSKCANPACNETFRYLHQGKIFRLAPTPAMHAIALELGSKMHERFWLCDACSAEFTIVWGGTGARVVRLQSRTEPARSPVLAFPANLSSPSPWSFWSKKKLAASAAREDREPSTVSPPATCHHGGGFS